MKITKSAQKIILAMVVSGTVLIGFSGVSLALSNTDMNTLAVSQTDLNKGLQKNPIVTKIINPVVNILSGLVATLVTAMIVVGGIQYSLAGDNPQKVTAAKKRITDALIALLVFMFIFAFVQWLIPGGIFS